MKEMFLVNKGLYSEIGPNGFFVNTKQVLLKKMYRTAKWQFSRTVNISGREMTHPENPSLIALLVIKIFSVLH